MCNGLVKFPRTPHLLWPLARPPKDDRVLSLADAENFLSGNITVEEKVDGANIGFSLDDFGSVRVQNRGSWLAKGAHPQFQPLWGWIAEKTSALMGLLKPSRILFGEWCFAVHSVPYDRLPDWFLAFDVFDCDENRFWSSSRRDELLRGTGIHHVPRMLARSASLSAVQRLLQSAQSNIGAHPVEGLYLRREGVEWLESRAKLVRPEFLLDMDEHWSERPLVRNKLAAEAPLLRF